MHGPLDHAYGVFFFERIKKDQHARHLFTTEGFRFHLA